MRAVVMSIVIGYILVLAGISPADAQDFPTDQGSFLVMGGFSFSSAGGDLYKNSENDRFNTLQLNPSVNYFAIPGLALGGKLIYNRNSQGDISSTLWSVGPNLMYFVGGMQGIPQSKGVTYPYISAGFLYGQIKNSYSIQGSKSSSTTSQTVYNFGAGVMYMVTNTVGLFGEGNFELDRMKPEHGNSANGNKFNIVAGFSIFIY